MPILPAEFNPTYSFIVNNLDYTAVYSSNLPDDNLENVIEQLKSTSFMIEGVGKVKYGDKFTLSGPNAVRVKICTSAHLLKSWKYSPCQTLLI